jgi:predicted kinase
MIVNIMVGPPCAGKTTLARQMLRDNPHMVRINRDELRRMMLGKIMVDNGYVEQSINQMVKTFAQNCMWANIDLIIDATHCKPKYITDIKNMVPKEPSYGALPTVTFKHIICDVPFWKQRWRNFWRWCRGGGWIPRSVSYHMDRNFRNTIELIKADKV